MYQRILEEENPIKSEYYTGGGYGGFIKVVF